MPDWYPGIKAKRRAVKEAEDDEIKPEDEGADAAPPDDELLEPEGPDGKIGKGGS